MEQKKLECAWRNDGLLSIRNIVLKSLITAFFIFSFFIQRVGARPDVWSFIVSTAKSARDEFEGIFSPENSPDGNAEMEFSGAESNQAVRSSYKCPMIIPELPCKVERCPKASYWSSCTTPDDPTLNLYACRRRTYQTAKKCSVTKLKLQYECCV